MPCHVRADGTAVFDSSVIVEILPEVAQKDRLLPMHGPSRILMLEWSSNT